MRCRAPPLSHSRRSVLHLPCLTTGILAVRGCAAGQSSPLLPPRPAPRPAATDARDSHPLAADAACPVLKPDSTPHNLCSAACPPCSLQRHTARDPQAPGPRDASLNALPARPTLLMLQRHAARNPQAPGARDPRVWRRRRLPAQAAPYPVQPRLRGVDGRQLLGRCHQGQRLVGAARGWLVGAAGRGVGGAAATRRAPSRLVGLASRDAPLRHFEARLLRVCRAARLSPPRQEAPPAACLVHRPGWTPSCARPSAA